MEARTIRVTTFEVDVDTLLKLLGRGQDEEAKSGGIGIRVSFAEDACKQNKEAKNTDSEVESDEYDYEDEIEQAYDDGYDDGFDQGYDTGFAEGYLEAKKEAKSK